jgi:gliding motility-associated-like protein
MSQLVTIFPYASFDLGADTSICPGGEAVELKAGNMNTFGGSATWKWSTGETGNKIRVVAPGTYYATITVNGCESSDSVIVSNDCYITIPNVFTPNGDGINDYFFPRELLSKGMIKFNMNVYNRWGQLIFTGNALDGRGWDGRFNGAEQPVGVYVYVIDAEFKDGQRENHKGNVTLLR